MVCIHFPLGLDVRTSDSEDWTFEVHPISSSCIHKEMYYQTYSQRSIHLAGIFTLKKRHSSYVL